MVTELFALVYIRDVYLHDGTSQRADAVVQGYRGVGIGSRVEHDAVVAEAHFLHLVDELALHIALVVGYVDVRKLSLQLGQILLERLGTVDAGLANAQQIQVGTIDNQDFLHHVVF